MCLFHEILCERIKNVSWVDIFIFSVSVAASKFCESFRMELIYVSLIKHGKLATHRNPFNDPETFGSASFKPKLLAKI